MKTKEDKLKLLEETAAYYRHSNRAVQLGKCVYHDDQTGNRCAIGRLCTIPQAVALQEQAQEEGADGEANVGQLWVYLPDSVKDYGQGFLMKIQELHDDDDNWTACGLSEHGKGKVADIKAWLDDPSILV